MSIFYKCSEGILLLIFVLKITSKPFDPVYFLGWRILFISVLTNLFDLTPHKIQMEFATHKDPWADSV